MKWYQTGRCYACDMKTAPPPEFTQPEFLCAFVPSPRRAVSRLNGLSITIVSFIPGRVIKTALSLAVIFLLPVISRAVDDPWDFSVQVSAIVQTTPAQITLSWPQDTNGTPLSYTVYRKDPTATSWGTGTALSGSATTYVDTTVTTGTGYEYQIVKATAGYTGYGYIRTGIEVPLVEQRGTVVLLVDNTTAPALTAELAQLQQDLAGDGWSVLRHDVARNDTVMHIKSIIKADYDADPASVNTVFLFGHIPVPRSGQINPDGHAEHLGAWAADVYYGDMDGVWTDSQVNFTQTVDHEPGNAALLSNVPGDGKFDQSSPPAVVKLQVGRVDLANMPGRLTPGGPPTFPGEVELLRNYLGKDHNFRQNILRARRRGIVGDFFGNFVSSTAPAASGFRNFAPLVGPPNVLNLNQSNGSQIGAWISTLAANDYLWAYGCGPGNYTYAYGLGSTAPYFGTTGEVVNNDIRAVFTLLWGSWFGDWDHEDDLLRAILATPTYGLAAGWSGWPHWYVHSMGMGETIGYSARLTQNNVSLYKTENTYGINQVHIALMGDPTLRMHPVGPPGPVAGSINSGAMALIWTASADSVLGYHVYRAASSSGPFTRLTSSLVTGTAFTDSSPIQDTVYMVRAVKLESSPSGSYYNASQGAFLNSAATVITTTAAGQLNNATVTTGHGVSFTAVGATGSIQWQISTDSGSTWANLTNGGSYSGAATATLAIANSTSALSGSRYRYVATNGNVQAISNAATLTVAPALFPFPTCIVADGLGNLYVGDSSTDTIQKVNSAGQTALVAGASGTAGANDGNGATAHFNQPGGITLLSSGVLIVTDTANATIRSIGTDGTVTTLAGSAGTRGSADGTGPAAAFSSPIGIAHDASGTLLVADAMNATLRKITSAGVVSLFAGAAGITGGGDGAGPVARFNFPTGLAIDGSGNIYASDTTNNTVRKIASDGNVTTLAGLAGITGASDGTGNSALFNHPAGLAVDDSGNLYVADTGNSLIRKITPTGVVSTIAGVASSGLEDGTGSAALFNQPRDLTLDSSGNIYVADTGNAIIRKITPLSVVTTLALSAAPAAPPTPTPMPMPTPTPAPTSGGNSSGGGGMLEGWFVWILGLPCLLRLIRKPSPDVADRLPLTLRLPERVAQAAPVRPARHPRLR